MASQEKYHYFLLAAAGAAIGFAVQKTDGIALSWWLLPVACATMSWALSFWCGCMAIRWVNTAMSANYHLLLLGDGRHLRQPQTPIETAAAKKGVTDAIGISIEKASTFAKFQFRLFVLGAVLFITWRVLEMSRLSSHA